MIALETADTLFGLVRMARALAAPYSDLERDSLGKLLGQSRPLGLAQEYLAWILVHDLLAVLQNDSPQTKQDASSVSGQFLNARRELLNVFQVASPVCWCVTAELFAVAENCSTDGAVPRFTVAEQDAWQPKVAQSTAAARSRHAPRYVLSHHETLYILRFFEFSSTALKSNEFASSLLFRAVCVADLAPRDPAAFAAHVQASALEWRQAQGALGTNESLQQLQQRFAKHLLNGKLNKCSCSH